MQNGVLLWEPDSLEKAFSVGRIVGRKIIATRNSTTHNYKYASVVVPVVRQPTRLTPQQFQGKSAKHKKDLLQF